MKQGAQDLITREKVAVIVLETLRVHIKTALA
jgi:hypothetical protein